MAEGGKGAGQQRPHIKLDSGTLHSVPPTDSLVVISPPGERVTCLKVAHVSFSLINKLAVSFCPPREEAIEAMHLLGAPVVLRSQLLLLNVQSPLA